MRCWVIVEACSVHVVGVVIVEACSVHVVGVGEAGCMNIDVGGHVLV